MAFWSSSRCTRARSSSSSSDTAHPLLREEWYQLGDVEFEQVFANGLDPFGVGPGQAGQAGVAAGQTKGAERGLHVAGGDGRCEDAVHLGVRLLGSLVVAGHVVVD